MDRIQLRDDLLTVFNLEEFQALCRRLGVEYEALRGKTQQDKAGILIGMMERNGRLPELVQELVGERPHLDETYAAYIAIETAAPDDPLSWLDRLARGEGPAIEEDPTMRWDTEQSKDEEGNG
ncbi:hypothetical protein MNBD_CHLOROFLEXI01-3722 [hydrothermal vent metagenome]|uniref:Effector-associated domain-containing protein n=1 Tax=hydrothermal vent metagenome TaxID=652676 RepID=A0A3B0VGV0_9ZZZZ